jgi:hypothetical protein
MGVAAPGLEPGTGPQDDVRRAVEWTTLVTCAHACLAAAATASTDHTPELVAMTVNELRRLFHTLVIEPSRRIADAITWSVRRRHQSRAQACHYARQALTEP